MFMANTGVQAMTIEAFVIAFAQTAYAASYAFAEGAVCDTVVAGAVVVATKMGEIVTGDAVVPEFGGISTPPGLFRTGVTYGGSIVGHSSAYGGSVGVSTVKDGNQVHKFGRPAIFWPGNRSASCQMAVLYAVFASSGP